MQTPKTAKERLAVTSQAIELTETQVAELRKSFEAMQKKYGLLPSELSWIMGSISAVIVTEFLEKKRGKQSNETNNN